MQLLGVHVHLHVVGTAVPGRPMQEVVGAYSSSRSPPSIATAISKTSSMAGQLARAEQARSDCTLNQLYTMPRLMLHRRQLQAASMLRPC